MSRIVIEDQKRVFHGQEMPEKDLNDFLCKHWNKFFPNLIFIKSEMPMEGDVRSDDSSGRVDIFAFNPSSRRFVVVELKRGLNQNIRSQAHDYAGFVEDYFSDIYLKVIHEYQVELPAPQLLKKDEVEMVLVAREFSSKDQNVVLKKKEALTLIKYSWFDQGKSGMLLLDYLNNEPLTDTEPVTEEFVNPPVIYFAQGDLFVQYGKLKASGTSVKDLFRNAIDVIEGTDLELGAILPFASSAKRYVISKTPKHPTGDKFVSVLEHQGYFMEANKSLEAGVKGVLNIFKALQDKDKV